MITAMELLGIYPDVIDNVIKTCEKLMRDFDFSPEDILKMHLSASKCFKKNEKLACITDSVIVAYYRATKAIMLDRFPDKDIRFVADHRHPRLMIGERMCEP